MPSKNYDHDDSKLISLEKYKRLLSRNPKLTAWPALKTEETNPVPPRDPESGKHSALHEENIELDLEQSHKST